MHGIVSHRNSRATKTPSISVVGICEKLTSVRQSRPTKSLAFACPIKSMAPVSRRSFVWWQPILKKSSSTPLERVFQFAAGPHRLSNFGKE